MQHRAFEEFAARLAEVDGQAHLVAGWAGAADLARGLAAGGSVVVSPSLAAAAPELIDALGEQAQVGSSDSAVAGAAEAAVGMVLGDLAIVETGSVLSSEDELADRAVSMLTPTLIQVAPAASLVSSLDDAADWLSQRAGRAGYAALITGPSRTADIERSLTIGIQGPAVVHVALLDDGGEA
ncbi:MAG TPA: LUD domain-containing protein [Egibacteraceae bacterium]|nr:LUD domain-containing protein [Egibacteraceae bacterium]